MENKVVHPTTPLYKQANIYPFAGFWIRSVAFTFDCTVISLILTSVFALLKVVNADVFSVPTSDSVITKMIHLCILIGYFILFTKYNHGQTLGKMLTGIRVVNSDFSSDLSWSQVLFREGIGRYIQNTLFFLYLIPAFTSRKQAVSDFVADTYVIKDEVYDLDQADDTPVD